MAKSLIFNSKSEYSYVNMTEKVTNIYNFLVELINKKTPFIIYPFADVADEDIRKQQFICFTGKDFIVHGESMLGSLQPYKSNVDYEKGRFIGFNSYSKEVEWDNQKEQYNLINNVLPIKIEVSQKYINWRYGYINIVDISQIKIINENKLNEITLDFENKLKECYANYINWYMNKFFDVD